MKSLILLCCVAAAFATCPENSRYKECGTACPLTCDNYQNPPKFCVLSCNSGCHCDEGYVKADDGSCVKPEECSAKATETCGDNEVYLECGTACPLTCDNYQNPPKVCVAMCKIGCACAEGFVRSADGRCVQPNQCEDTGLEPKDQSCFGDPDPGMCRGAFDMWYFNEKTGKCHEFIYGGCQGNGNRHASEEACLERCGPRSPATEVCALPHETGPCRAYMPSYYYNAASGHCEKFIYGGCGGNANRFDTIEECHNTCLQKAEPECPAGEHFEPCGTACPLTCDNYQNPPKFCVLSCNIGCHCDEGLVRNAQGQCVQPQQCSSQANAELCALPTETGPCKAYFVRFHFDASSGECKEFVYGGCRGNANNFKTKEECHNTCKPQASTAQCPANEHYEECGTACPLTCDNHQNPPFACIKMCNEGCHCDKGYVRNGDGFCVKPSQCPAGCGANSEFTTCGTACPTTCENFKDPPMVCTDDCRVGCACDVGFVLKGDSCVPPDYCYD